MVELDPRRPPVTSAPPIAAVAEIPVELDHAARSQLAVRCTQGCDALPTTELAPQNQGYVN